MNAFKIPLMVIIVMMTFVVGLAFAEDARDRDEMDMAREGSIRVSEFMDLDVVDQQGNELGSVKDILINRDGDAEFLILSHGGGFFGLGREDLTPIPWDMVQAQEYSPDRDEITVAVDEEMLRDAPSFSDNDEEWRAVTQGEMDQDVRGYYGVEDRRDDQDRRMNMEDNEAGAEEYYDKDDLDRPQPPPGEGLGEDDRRMHMEEDEEYETDQYYDEDELDRPQPPPGEGLGENDKY